MFSSVSSVDHGAVRVPLWATLTGIESVHGDAVGRLRVDQPESVNQMGCEGLPCWHLAGPKKAWVVVVCPEKACVLVTHETADANMRLLLGKTIYGFTGPIIHQLGVGGLKQQFSSFTFQ